MEQEIQQLKAELEEYKKKVDDLYSLANFPEEVARGLSKKGFMRVVKSLRSFGQSGATFDEFFTEFDNVQTVISGIPASQYVPFSVANISTDTLSGRLGADTIGMQVVAVSSSELPDTLLSGQIYYIINATGTTFQLSGTPGGSPIPINDSGTGFHFVRFI